MKVPKWLKPSVYGARYRRSGNRVGSRPHRLNPSNWK